MDAKNGYCSAQLKQAKNMARDGYYAASITAVRNGIESLLKELFDELRDTDKNNLYALSNSYYYATEKIKWSIKKDGERELSLYGWIKFYKKEKIFRKLKDTFGYKFAEFNPDNLHEIRMKCNEFGAHPNEQYEKQRELSRTLIDQYSKLLSETGRIAQPSSILPSNQLQIGETQELQLLPNEKSLLKQQYDDILRVEPNNLDVRFQRAYLLRGQKTAQDDIDKILLLTPHHSEAKKEQNWYKNQQSANKQTSQTPTFILNHIDLTQIKNTIIINLRVGDVIVVVLVVILLLGVWQERRNVSNNTDLQQLQRTVVKQSTQLEHVENELKEKDAQVEALKADLQQLQRTVHTRPAELAESANDFSNIDAMTPSIGIQDNRETQHVAKGVTQSGVSNTIVGFLARSIGLLLAAFIFLLLVWWIFSRYILPPVTDWIISQISLPILVWLIIRLLTLSIREFIRGLFRR